MRDQRKTSKQVISTWLEDSGCFFMSGCLSLAATFFLLFPMLTFGVLFLVTRETSVYVQGSCTIRHRWYFPVRDTHPDSQGAIHYPVNFDYTLMVGGRAYQGKRYKVYIVRTDSEKKAQEILHRYEIGKTYPCWYNPVNPSESVLDRDEHLGQQALTFLLAFVLFLLLSILLWPKMK